MPELLQPVLTKNDKQARVLILVFSFVVFAAVSLLTQVKIQVNLGFDVHVFALLNAVINTIIVVLLIAALIAAILPVGFIWERLAKLKLFEVEIELNDFAGRTIELPAELHDQNFLAMGPSYLPIIVDKIRLVINQSL